MTKKETKQCALVRTTVNALDTAIDRLEDWSAVLRRRTLYLATHAHCIHDDDVLDTMTCIVKALRRIEADASSATADVFKSIELWTSIPNNEETENE